ncbi:MAG: hypothetical protein KC912_14570 [Proteobacteria bacterium]|nr:hypothetical protein [Pseudomonadota bacterium]
MNIAINSEVGALQEVLVHRPGDEIVRMTQDELDRLLFDDILSPAKAAAEHELLSDVLAGGGARVHDVANLLVQALHKAPEEAIRHLVGRSCELAHVPELAPILAEWEPEKLGDALIVGLRWDEITDAPMTLARIRASRLSTTDRALAPLPNLMFMRDPCISVYERVLPAQMATPARAREPLLVAFALRYGLSLGSDSFLFPSGPERAGTAHRALEGGDLLVISPKFLLMGCSERTRPESIEHFARDALFPAHPELESIYAVLMPKQRSVMHLDTILTQVDRGLFLCHEPLICGTPERPGLEVVRLQRDRPPELLAGASVADVLRNELGRDVEFAPCGGHDPLHQEREQWTDGANAVAIGPGRIVLYSRNTRTIETLCKEYGFLEICLTPVQPMAERRELIGAGMECERAVFAFTGSELSRARGGGRCLTMPLRRE